LIRDRNFRQPRRRDFEDDGYDPHLREFGGTPRFPTTRFEAPSGPPVRAVVKWFKPERGFGFVELADGSGDAFLHATVLERNGIAAVQPGETLEVRVAPGQKGPQVTEVLSVDSSTAVQGCLRARLGARAIRDRHPQRGPACRDRHRRGAQGTRSRQGSLGVKRLPRSAAITMAAARGSVGRVRRRLGRAARCGHSAGRGEKRSAHRAGSSSAPP